MGKEKRREGGYSMCLKTVFCRDSARGSTMQMCGRVFRRHPGTPFKQIVQSRLTSWPFTRIAAAKQQWLWEAGGWRSLEPNPRIELASARARLAIASSKLNSNGHAGSKIRPEHVKRNSNSRSRGLRNRFHRQETVS